MKIFEEYLSGITDMEKRARMVEILKWVSGHFPELEPRVAWNQPMFTDHGTFIIGFSMSKQHIAVSPEKAGIDHFLAEIENVGYGHGTNLFRIKWGDYINYTLLEKVIKFNREEKSNCTSFWRI